MEEKAVTAKANLSEQLASLPLAQETPVNHDRGFSILLPANPAPMDERALSLGIRIALPIAPTEPRKKVYSQKTNGHHAAGFPAEHPDLQGDDLRVLRWVRVQEGLRILHWQYHEHYDGILLSETEHERFLATLLYSAGYVPAEGVDVSAAKPKVIRLTDNMLNRLHDPGVLHQQEGMHWRIGYFFGRYIIKHGLEPIKKATEVSQFLETSDHLRRHRLGHDVIRLAAEAVIDPIESVYQQARATGQISHVQPGRALRFMMKHFDARQPDYFDVISRQLETALAA